MGQEKKQEVGWILAKQGKPSILSLDIDKAPLREVEKYVKNLQKTNDVGTAVIVESSDLHFHIYFFWKFMTWKKTQKLIHECKIADPEFQQFTSKNRFIRMRITNLYKPYLRIIKSHSNSMLSPSNYGLGDFYFKHYLFLTGFAQESINHYLSEVR